MDIMQLSLTCGDKKVICQMSDFFSDFIIKIIDPFQKEGFVNTKSIYYYQNQHFAVTPVYLGHLT